jgi:AcrR family transcriptional regulator
VATRLTGDKRRATIIRAARRLFAAQGYERTKMEDVAKAAGCTTGPVYHFFGSKRDLYAAALRSGIRDARGSIDKLHNSSPDASPMQRLLLSCDRLLDLLSVRETTNFALEAPRVLGYDAWQELFEHGLIPLLERDLRAAMMDGELDPEASEPLAVLIAGAILTCGNRMATIPRDESFTVELERFRNALRRMILRLRVEVPAI